MFNIFLHIFSALIDLLGLGLAIKMISECREGDDEFKK